MTVDEIRAIAEPRGWRVRVATSRAAVECVRFKIGEIVVTVEVSRATGIVVASPLAPAWVGRPFAACRAFYQGRPAFRSVSRVRPAA